MHKKRQNVIIWTKSETGPRVVTKNLKRSVRKKEGEGIMVAQTVKVVNEQGLHMRPAGVFAKEMTKFSCAVTLDVAGKKINAKSVMLIIAACIKCGAEVTVECDGADEKEALAKAVELIESGFGE